MPDSAPTVLILGAGINGAAIARELALTGANLVVVDTADIAGGATSASSRLVHGGLRYLEHGEVALVRESLEERSRLTRLAPQFVRPLRLQIPVAGRLGGLKASLWTLAGRETPASGRGLWLVRAGLLMYEQFGRDPLFPPHQVRTVGSPGVAPVDPARYQWTCAYSDAQLRFPERFVLAMLEDARQICQAARRSFLLYTYHEALRRGRAVEIRPVDSPQSPPVSVSASPASGLSSASGAAPVSVSASPVSGLSSASGAAPVATLEPQAIVNATGAWVDLALQRLAIPSRKLMGGTKGSHFVTSHPELRKMLREGGLYAEAPDGRPIFILPLGPSVLVGTTDEPFTGDPGEAVAGDAEIDYLLASVSAILPEVRLTREDLDFHYSGVRPLPASPGDQPGAITRRHWLEEHACDVPFFSVIGGKLTTCRSLAEQTAAKLLPRLGMPRHVPATRERPFPGGEDYPANAAELASQQAEVAQSCAVSSEQLLAVWELVGTRAEEYLVGLADEDRASVPGTEFPRGVVRRMIEREWTTGLADLVERRLMLLYHQRLTRSTLRALAELLAGAGRFTLAQVDVEVDREIARLAARYGKQVVPH